jgi:ABC-type uncharacterized transport system substrate-binding protein
MFRFLLLPLLALLLTAAGSSAAPPAEVLVIVGKDQGAHARVVEAMQAALTKAAVAPRVTVITAEAYRRQPREEAYKPNLIASVGTEAARVLSESPPSAPVLHTLIPRQVFLELAAVAGPGARVSAIYLDQPFARQLDLVRVALPKASRLGVLLGPTSQSLQAELTAAARARGLRLDVERIATEEELLPALKRVLEDSDALLSVADPVVLNNSTVHHLLLTTYHQRVPVVGLSRGYVEAGAALAVHSTPEQIGRQLGELAAELAATGRWRLPPPQYPQYYSVTLNNRVLDSLGLRLEPEEAILRKLRDAAP